MTEHLHDPDEQFNAAVNAAREQAQQGLPEPRLHAIEQELLARITTPIQPHSANARWLWGFVGAGALAAVLVTAWPFVFAPTAPAPKLAEKLPAQILLRSGAIAADDTQVPWTVAETQVVAQRTLKLAAGARLDVRLPDGAIWSNQGPAIVRINAAGHPELADGIAAFSVPPHPAEAPFRVHVGTRDVVVTGTRFAVVAAQGELLRVEVTEGTVKVANPEGATTAFVTAGERFGAKPTDEQQQQITRLLATTGPAADPVGSSYLAVESSPESASVLVDGREVGVAPVLVRVSAGKHQVRVSAPGFRTWEQEGNTTTTTLTRWTATLTSLPAANVRVSELSTSDRFARAEAALRRRDCRSLERQVGPLQTAGETRETQARAHTLIAECQLRRGNKTRAYDAFVTISERFADTAAAEPALFQAAALAQEQGKRAQALRLVDRYLKRFPDGALTEAALVRRCELLLSQKQLDLAGECLNRYRTQFPTGQRRVEVVFLLATRAALKERWPEAAELYREYLALQDDDNARREEALYQRVVALKQGGLSGVNAAAAAYRREFPEGRYAMSLPSAP